MSLPRVLLGLFAASLSALLLAAAPASAGGQSAGVHKDVAALSPLDSSAQSPKPVDHSSRRTSRAASLEEFFEMDDDAEQYFKAPPVPVRGATASSVVVARPSSVLCPVAFGHRRCAPYPTGPPSV